MATSAQRTISDLPVSPGSILEEELEERGVSHAELAKSMGKPAYFIDSIVAGETPIVPATADDLESALGISAQFWLNLESAYRQTLARQNSRERELVH